MPLSVEVGVDLTVPFSLVVLAFFSSSEEDEGFVEVLGSLLVAAAAAAASACLRFFLLLPGAFFSACVRPFSLSVFKRSLRRAMSVGAVGRMGMTSFSAYGSLHCLRVRTVRVCYTSLRN